MTPQTPERLYHYTDLSGLTGIVSSGTVWATSIHHMSDWREFSYGLELAKKVIDDRRSSPDCSEFERGYLDTLEDEVDCISDSLVFVFSLSQRRDLLSQWRAYGSAGAGYSIGFDVEELRHVSDGVRFSLGRCQYKRAAQRDLVENNVDFALEIVDQQASLESGVYDSTFGNPIREFRDILTSNAGVLKDASFREEKEWRLVSHPVVLPHERVGFREGASMLVPYFELDVTRKESKLPISSIMVGPTPNREHAVAGARWLLRQHEIEATVDVSSIPYREW